MTYTLLRPPEGMTGFLRLIWPLVYVQLVALKARTRTHYVPGVPYWYTVSSWGRVSLRHMPIDFAEARYAASGALKPLAFDFALSKGSTRLALALAPEVCAPVPVPVREEQTCSAHVLSETAFADTS